MDAPDFAAPWSRRRFLATAAAAPIALGLPLRPGILPGILRPYGGAGTTYYVSAAGNDDNDGTRSTAPWRTLARVSQGSYGPGDRILLRAGDTFSVQQGSRLTFDSRNIPRPTPAAPVRVGRYGSGPNPMIQASDSGTHGIAVMTGGIEIEDLNIVGLGYTGSTASGISLWTNPDHGSHSHVRLRRLRTIGFRNGIAVGSWSGNLGFSDVLIEDCETFENAEGISVYAEWSSSVQYFPHTNLVIRRVKAHHNPGREGHNSGFGILVQGVEGGVIEDCEAYENGRTGGRGDAGPVGIMLYHCRNVVIQRCYSHDNHSATVDGGGIDIDGGCTNCVIQYCYTRRNQSFGYFLANFVGAGLYSGNVLRYSISEMDRRESTSPQGGISIWNDSRNAAGKFVDTYVYGNTVYVDATSPDDACALEVLSGGGTLRTRIFNNILIARGGKHLIDIAGGQTDLRLQGNNYHTYGDPVLLQWEGTRYSNLEALREGTGQERLAGDDVGTDADPRLTAPGRGGYIAGVDRLTHLRAYRLLPGSPMPTAGIDLRAAGIDPGERDFFGARIPPESAFRAVGAASTADGVENTPAENPTAAGGEESRGRLERSRHPFVRGRPQDSVQAGE